jgi:hypothetical protein
MQNPSALSRTENMPMLRVHRGSSVAMKNSSLNAQMDSTHSRTPILHNGTSTAVYPQMNGSASSLQYTKNNNAGTRSPRLLPRRRHSEEEESKKDDTYNQESRDKSPSRRSSGSVHGSVRDFSDEPLSSETADAQTSSVYERRKGEFSHQLSTTSEPEPRPRYFSAANKQQMEKIREQLSLELAENGHNSNFKK